MSASALLFISFIGNAIAQSGTACNTYLSGQTPPTGYGAAWDVLSSNRDLLLSAYCFDDKSVNYTVGKKEQNQYIYKVGYYYDSSWRPMTFTGTFADGSTDWLVGEGTLTRSSPPEGQHFWVGYVCTWTGSQWKCGCRDQSCTQNYWQLQAVPDPSAGGSGGGSAAGDDTFACLGTYKGPVVKKTGNQGSEGFRAGRFFDNESRFDFRGAVFNQWSCTGSCPSKQPNAGPFPLLIGGNWQTPPTEPKACLVGATVRGVHPRNMDWSQAKKTSGALEINAREMFVDGLRLDNMGEDAIRPGGIERFQVQNNWVSWTYDDCVENDGKTPGMIQDNLFDGCFQFYSAVAGGKSRPAGGLVEILNNLIKLDATGSSPSHRGYFKMWDGNSPSVTIHSNVFVADILKGPTVHNSWGGRLAGSGELSRIKSCSGNLFLWLGSGALDRQLLTDGLPSGCFAQILEGSAAQSAWDKIKQNWINCHPLVPRISGDPQSNPSNCQANAYGGGQGGTQIPQ